MQESLEASLVRIRTADGRVVGAGFLVGERHILTCAHVISQAFNLPNIPLDAPQTAVSLDFPLIPPRTLLTAKVVLWCPQLSDGRGDIAGLELDREPPAGAEVVRFAPAEDVWEHPFRVFGFPAGYDDGVWATGRLLGRQATDWVMIEDVKAQGFAVAPGFSGTAVWDTQLQGVVGMVVAASRAADTKTAFVIPLDVLVAAWPLIEPITRQRVFLSAAPADTAFADRLATDLQARDIVVWTEQHPPDAGHAEQEERVRQAIRAAQAVVLIVSSQTRSSRTVREHLRLADLYRRRLILVWVGDDEHVQPPPGWQETVWVDARDTRYTAAIEAIEANLSQRRPISGLLGPSHAAAEEAARAPRNPYKGLHAFTADDTGDFFGRERLVDALVKDVAEIVTGEQPAGEGGRLLTIIGPSGSGKSSVVMAGLLPRLQRRALPGSNQWVYLEPMVPGKHPIEALGLTLKPHFPDTSLKTLREDLEDDATRGLHVLAAHLVKRRDSRVVLLVDQLEELFTQTEDEDERRRFIELLLTAVTEPRGPLLALLTLRADFYDRPMHYAALFEQMQAHLRPVPLMELDELRATIEQPAALPDVQLSFEGNLVGDLLFEMQGQVGALPLLQFTLEQLFERRIDHRLILSAYREIGGVKGALSQYAEKTYAALPSEEHRRLTRALFLRLIDPGASEQDTTRRRAALAEFSLADETTTRLLRETADAFIAARLLTTNEVAGTTTIELSHEAVVRAWKRLVDWIREAHEDIHLLQVIREDAAEWRRYGHSVDRLYRGTELAEALAWRERSLLSLDEEAFLQASAAEQARQEALTAFREQQEALQRERYTRRTVLVGLVGGGLTVVALGVITLLLREKSPVQTQPITPSVLPITLPYRYPVKVDVRCVAWSPDGTRLASAGEDYHVQVWDASTGQTLQTYREHTAPVLSVTWSPDGTRLASAGEDHTVQVWDAYSGHRLLPPYTGHTHDVRSVAWSPDGKLLASASQDHTVQVWNASSGHRLLPPYTGHTDEVNSAAWSPDGKHLASASNDKTVRVWNASSGQTLLTYTGHKGGVNCVAWSPSGKHLASASQDHTVQVWNASSGQTSFTYTEHKGGVNSVAWSPDGTRLASASQDLTLWVWDVGFGQTLLTYTGHTRDVRCVAWSPDGKHLASASNDKTVQVWDASSGQTLQTYRGHTAPVLSAAWSPDGMRLTSAGEDHTVQVWDASSGHRLLLPYKGHTRDVRCVAWSPDGTRLASASQDHTVQVWDASSGHTLFTYTEHNGDVNSVAWSPDGTRLASASDDHTVRVWNASSGQTLFIYKGHTDVVTSVAWSPDGKHLASASNDKTVQVWDASTGQTLLTYKGHTRDVNSAAWSPDGTRLASASNDKTVRVWDASTGHTLFTYTEHTSIVNSAAWSPDGTRLASASDDQVVQVWLWLES